MSLTLKRDHESMVRKYICENCRKEYETTRNDEDAKKEFLERFPECIDEPLSIVCDGCAKSIYKWIDSLSMEERLSMRDRMRAKWKSLS